MCNNGTGSLVQAQQLPTDWLVTRAPAADLPNSHDGVVLVGEADGMDFDHPNITIIAKLKDVA
jgi:hypothetical protein